MISASAMLSIFIREPEFVGQTKDRLATAEAQRIVESSIRDSFDIWLASSPQDAARLIDWVVDRADERLRRRQEKEVNRKSATRKLRLPGKLSDCSQTGAAGAELFIVEGDSAGGSAKQARDRARRQAILPLRGKILNVANATRDKLSRQPADRRPDRWRSAAAPAPEFSRCGPALRARDHHDGCRRRRRPHRLAADHLLLPGRCLDLIRQGAPLPRRSPRSTASQQGWQDCLCPQRQAHKRPAHREA